MEENKDDGADYVWNGGKLIQLKREPAYLGYASGIHQLVAGNWNMKNYWRFELFAEDSLFGESFP